jgi:phage N-6-adenine-methyltransferase
MSEMNSVVPLEGPTGLAAYDAAVRAVAAATSVDEIKAIQSIAAAMTAAGKVSKNRAIESNGAELRFRADRHLGELMRRQAETVGLATGGEHGGKRALDGSRADPSNKKPTLAEAGIDKHLADRARKYAAIPEDQFNDMIEDWRRRVETENERISVNLTKAGGKHVRGTLGTGENEWYTPQEHIDRAARVLGGIDLDPASSLHAQEKVRAKRFFDVEKNGLNQEWQGTVWLNPPYAQPLIGQFMAKLCEEVSAGRTTAAIALTHNYTDTRWFQDTAEVAAAICFTRGRIRFYSPSGEIAAPTQGQAFFYFGNDADTFADEFQHVGFVVRLLK